jgi:hypothetical protein
MGLGTGTPKAEVDDDEQRGKQASMLKGWLASAVGAKKGARDGDTSKLPDKRATRLLVVVGTYSIGKEKVVKGLLSILVLRLLVKG